MATNQNEVEETETEDTHYKLGKNVGIFFDPTQPDGYTQKVLPGQVIVLSPTPRTLAAYREGALVAATKKEISKYAAQVEEQKTEALSTPAAGGITSTTNELLTAALTKASEHVATAQLNAASITQEANTTADGIIQEAKDLGTGITDEAKKKADKILEDAKKQADKILDDAKKAAASKQGGAAGAASN